MTADQIRHSEFPIFGDRPMSAGEEHRKIGCIDPSARAIIKTLQPHFGGHNYRDDPLWQIYEIDRVDKHQTLTLCIVISDETAIVRPNNGDWNVGRIMYAHVTPGELTTDAVFMRYIVMPLDPSREVKLNPTLAPYVAFAYGAASGQSVIPAMNGLCDYVRDVILPSFSQFL